MWSEFIYIDDYLFIFGLVLVNVFSIFDNIFLLFLLVLFVIVSFNSFIRSWELLCFRLVVNLLNFLVKDVWEIFLFIILGNIILLIDIFEIEVRDIVFLLFVFIDVGLFWIREWGFKRVCIIVLCE